MGVRGDKALGCTHAGNGSQPTVSVIVPTYNHAHFLVQAIDSVLLQTCQHFELIVVDDGSTDDTRSVLARFGERIRYVWQENRGLSAARNCGLRLATGRFIALLDADDLYEPELLARLVRLLEEHPAAGAAYCGYRCVDDANRPLPQAEAHVVPPAKFRQRLLLGNFLAAPGVMVRDSCYASVGGFDESLRACEDWDMWLRLAERFRFVGTAALLLRNRVTPTSMSSDPARMQQARLQVLGKHLGSEPHGTADGAAQRAHGRMYLAGCIEWLQAKDEEQAYDFLAKAIAADPSLLLELESFYELACGGQTRGRRGHFAWLDVDASARRLAVALARLSGDPRTRQAIATRRRQAYGNAYLATGLLNYGARRLPQARAHLLRAVRANPLLAVDRRLASTLTKTFLLQVGLSPRRKRADN